MSADVFPLAREECVHLGWEGHNPNATFQCVAYTLRPMSDEISHFSRQTAMPLTGRSLFTEHGVVCSLTLPRINPGDSWFNDHCDVSEELSSYMVSPSVNFRVSHGITATNRQIVRTPNLNATSFGRPFLWEVVDCHFTLPFVSRVGFSPPCFCLGDGESLCQKGDSPM